MKRVLSIDGGGLRGIIPAMVIAELEKRSGKPAAQMFDLIAGTSTGGLLAAALSIGKPADDIVRMYKDNASRIFPYSFWRRWGNLFFDEKYPADGLETVLAEVFDGLKMSDAKTALLIPAFDIERQDSFFFKSHGEQDWYLRDVCRATSAAPTYFEPAIIKPVAGGDSRALIDGGVVFNNPAMCAYAEAKALWPDEEITLLSLGTGECVSPVWRESVKRGSAANWGGKLLNIMFSGGSRGVHYQARQLLGSKYKRLQPTLGAELASMDEWSGNHIPGLCLVGEVLSAEAPDI